MKNKKKEKIQPASTHQYSLSLEEIAHLLRGTPQVKHRLLIEIVYGLGLDLEETVNIKLSEIDLISGIVYLPMSDRFMKLPQRLHNLLKFYIQQHEPQEYLLETQYGKLKEEAAEKIIQTLTLRNIGKSVNSSLLQEAASDHRNILTTLQIQYVNALPLSTSF